MNLNDLIKSGNGTGSTRRARRQYGIMVVAEIGFAMALVCGAALLVRAARQLSSDAQAWDQSMLSEVRIRVNQPPGGTRTLGDISADLVSRMRAIDDVADATLAVDQDDTDREVSATDPGGKMHVVPAAKWSYTVVSPSYLRTMGFGVSRGRDFEEGERDAVAIVDAHTARLLWPSTDPVGQMIKFGSPNKPGRWYTVIGVRKPIGIESTNQGPLAYATRNQADLGATQMGTVYALPSEADTVMGARADQTWKNRGVELVVRARKNPLHVPVAIRQALAGDTRYYTFFAGTFDQWTGAAARRENQNFVGGMFTLFAALALALAALGVYGIVSHSVAERKREIGVRIALGSSARDILYVILREGNVFALAGMALGLILIDKSAWLFTRFLRFPEGDIYSLELYIPAGLFLFAVAAIAAFIPARRATKIDPVEALRCE